MENDKLVQRILLIDDNKGTNYFNKKKLEKLKTDLEITCVQNGKEALDLLLGNYNADLILLDINMPVMSGEVFLKALDEHNVKSPQIVVLMGADLSEEKKSFLGNFDRVNLLQGKMLTAEMIQNILELTKLKFE